MLFSIEAALLYGKACWLGDDRGRAAEIFEGLYRKAQPEEKGEVALLIAAVYHSLGSPKRALDWVERLPEAPIRERLRCFFLFRIDEIDQAIVAGKKAVSGNPSDPIAHVLLGRALVDDVLRQRRDSPEKLSESLDVVRRAVELDDTNRLALDLRDAAESINKNFDTRGRSRRSVTAYAASSGASGPAAPVHSRRGFFDEIRRLPFTDPGSDFGKSITADGKEFYFGSNRTGGCSWDIWVATLEENGTWGEPRNLREINTCQHEETPVVSPDGLELFFARRAWPQEKRYTTYVATRHERGEAWSHVRPLEINSEDGGMPGSVPGSLSSDGKTLYFVSGRPEDDFGVKSKGPRGDIFVATRPSREERFGDVRNLEEINSRWADVVPSISADGLTIFWGDFGSFDVRPGGEGWDDIWMATRDSVDEAFGRAINIGPPVNTPVDDTLPFVSAEWPAPSSKLYFGRHVAGFGGELLEATWHPDCNGNGIDDLEDIRNSTSQDTNGDGKPDECEPDLIDRRE